MEKIIDARKDGLSPEIMAITQEGLANLGIDERLEILVGDQATACTVEKLGRSMDLQANCINRGHDYSVSFFSKQSIIFPNLENAGIDGEQKQNVLFTISKAGLGEGDLGVKLLEKFFTSLKGLQVPPQGIIFYNEGVKVLAPDSKYYKHLVDLRDLGVSLWACSTSLEYYKIPAQKQKVLYRKIEMLDMVAYLAGKYKVISL